MGDPYKLSTCLGQRQGTRKNKMHYISSEKTTGTISSVIKLKSRRTLANETGGRTLARAFPFYYCHRRIQLVALTTKPGWVEILTYPRSWVTDSRVITKTKTITLLRDSHNLSPTRKMPIIQSLFGTLGQG